MASQRPSTSSQAHLNTSLSASRSKLEKELKELLDIAINIKDESVFQQENRYKKFKAKNHTINQAHELPILGRFFHGLNELKFHKEIIYWNKKILEDVRLCESPERSVAIFYIAKSFYALDDFEKVLKYGAKYFEISLQTTRSEDRLRRRCLLLLMQDAARHGILNRWTSQYNWGITTGGLAFNLNNGTKTHVIAVKLLENTFLGMTKVRAWPILT